MTASLAMLGCAGVLGVLVACAHSLQGERFVFGPLSSGAQAGDILRHPKYRRLFWAFWHFPSFVWAALGFMALGAAFGRWHMGPVLDVAIATFSASGLINLWANRTLHLGWVILFTTATLLAGARILRG